MDLLKKKKELNSLTDTCVTEIEIVTLLRV